MSTLQRIPLKTLAGAPASLNDYAGKVLLIVNVASKCGFTPQYAGLEALYNLYKDRGLVVLGFPANDFGNQEPGTSAEIAQFCSLKYNVTFPMFEKIVASGAQIHPLYRELITKAPTPETNGPGFRDNLVGWVKDNGFRDLNPLPEVVWNFEKFLVGRDGEVITRYGTEVVPTDKRVIAAIEKALG